MQPMPAQQQAPSSQGAAYQDPNTGNPNSNNITELNKAALEHTNMIQTYIKEIDFLRG